MFFITDRAPSLARLPAPLFERRPTIIVHLPFYQPLLSAVQRTISQRLHDFVEQQLTEQLSRPMQQHSNGPRVNRLAKLLAPSTPPLPRTENRLNDPAG